MLETVRDIDTRWQDRLGLVEYAVEDTPQLPDDWSGETVPLASLVRGQGGTPTRLVLFRRPIEHRCETRADLEAMVLTVVVEQVAELLGIDAEDVDPRYSRRRLSAGLSSGPGEICGTSPCVSSSVSGITVAPSPLSEHRAAHRRTAGHDVDERRAARQRRRATVCPRWEATVCCSSASPRRRTPSPAAEPAASADSRSRAGTWFFFAAGPVTTGSSVAASAVTSSAGTVIDTVAGQARAQRGGDRPVGLDGDAERAVLERLAELRGQRHRGPSRRAAPRPAPARRARSWCRR